ncbi:MAG TPA: RagB/SusD family nutrient uptake outer membrane protein, partial [Saprospiraceae bacterium]|nr:RagB/SusD family nutrient uptake outer membrane protein [Saprospiraceae bacterium]
TDEAILPYRGGTDWGDNGIYIELHKHTYNSRTANVRNTWNPLVQALSRCVTAINELPTVNDPNKNVYLAEAIGMRAFYNMQLFDLYGLVFKKDDPGAPSEILRGEQALNYLIDEFKKAEPNLRTRSEVGHGRITKGAVWGLLARLYLNGAVYRDRYAASFQFPSADMDEVIKYCDQIINSNQYELSREYFEIFDDKNNTNKEIIFAADQRFDLNGHNRFAYFSLSGDQYPLPEFPGANGTDGPGITSDFYRSWVNAYPGQDPTVDPRFHKRNLAFNGASPDTCYRAQDFIYNRGILRGNQYGLVRVSGNFVKCADGRFRVAQIFNLSRNRPTFPVNFTENIDFTTQGSDYSTGYRVLKYEFSSTSNTGRNRGEHDIVILRLADVFLMRAEAQLRKNNAAAALADVNRVRAARTARNVAPPLASINLDLLFRERGFEFYWECLRRTDMIRFGKYEDTWTEKDNNDRNKRIFPLPQTAIDGA